MRSTRSTLSAAAAGLSLLVAVLVLILWPRSHRTVDGMSYLRYRDAGGLGVVDTLALLSVRGRINLSDTRFIPRRPRSVEELSQLGYRAGVTRIRVGVSDLTFPEPVGFWQRAGFELGRSIHPGRDGMFHRRAIGVPHGLVALVCLVWPLVWVRAYWRSRHRAPPPAPAPVTPPPAYHQPAATKIRPPVGQHPRPGAKRDA